MAFHLLLAKLLLVLVSIALLVTADACNPLVASCAPIPGLPNNSYSIDFTQQTETTGDWILADHATVTYGASNGANFTFGKRKDAPYIWTRFYVLFGRIEVVLKAAPGAGIITGAVMMSDDLDEIDWEWSGNNFAQNKGLVQTNFFGKGIAGNYGRGTAPPVDSPQDQFHTYALDWTPDSLTWSIDGKAVRTLNNNHETSGEWQYPQTPSRLHLGLWCSGDPETNSGGTVGWGGGLTDFSKVPYSAFVKSVSITTPNPCPSWKYPNPFDGIYKSVQCTNETISLPCTYSVVAGDDGYKIAKNLTVNFDTLKAANPGVDWDKLLLDQVLKVPGGVCSTSSTTSSASSMTMSSSSSLKASSSATSSSSSSSSSSKPYVSSSSNPSASSSSTNPYTSLFSTSSQSSLPTTSTSTRTTSSITPSTSSDRTSSSSLSKTTSSSSTSFSSSMTTSSQSTTSSSKAPITTSSAGTSTNSGGPMNGTTTSSAASPASSQYKVAAGDYGYSIAQKIGCTFNALKGANPGLDWDRLSIGQTLNVPSTSSSSSASSGSSTEGGGSSTSEPSASTNRSNSGPSSRSSGGSSSFSGSASGSQVSTSTSNQASTTASNNNTGSTTTSSRANPSSSPSSAPSTTGGTFAYGSSATPIPQSGSNPNTSQANIVQPTVAPNATTSTLKCNEDNCLRNVLDNRYLVSSSGYAFCTNYLNAPSTKTLPVPTYYSGCQGNASRWDCDQDRNFWGSFVTEEIDPTVGEAEVVISC